MLFPGLVSITFRQYSPEQIIGLARDAGLSGIEWGGDVHVPHGDLEVARRVSKQTRAAGLEVSAYGSYYRLGVSARDGLSFATVLHTAEALGAPLVRVWAGDRNAEEAAPSYRQRIVDESRSIGDLAGQKSITVVYEFHSDTLANTHESCAQLLAEVDHPHVRTYWQPMHGAGAERNSEGIRTLLPWIRGVHVFHWWPTHLERYSLSAGLNDWKQYMSILWSIPVNIFASLEFVKGDGIDQFRQDAQILKTQLLG